MGITMTQLCAMNFEEVMRLEQAAFLKDPHEFEEHCIPIIALAPHTHVLYGQAIDDKAMFAEAMTWAKAEMELHPLAEVEAALESSRCPMTASSNSSVPPR